MIKHKIFRRWNKIVLNSKIEEIVKSYEHYWLLDEPMRTMYEQKEQAEINILKNKYKEWV